MRRPRHRLQAAALALAAACVSAAPARARETAGSAAPQVAAVEAWLRDLEADAGRPGEPAPERARRLFARGQLQYLVGDWFHAAVLLQGALDEPGFGASADAPRALAWLGDALRQQGDCGAALATYEELLAAGPPALQPAALAGALDCRISLHRLDGVEPLLARVAALPPGAASPELRYLAGKAIYFRKDLRPAVRLARGLAAFDVVKPPWHVAAAYFQGTLLVEAGDLPAAAERFDLCLTLKGNAPRQAEIREHCALAAGRVQAERQRLPEAVDRYRAIPWDSPRFDEATWELAWAEVRGGRLVEARDTADLIVDLSPESQLAPEATILAGHLALRLGRFGDAAGAFQQVIDTWSPVRDELDALGAARQDPFRWFNELAGRRGPAFDAPARLPIVAARWASAQPDVAAAAGLVASLDEARREVAESRALAERIEARLRRGDGLDAAPPAREGWIAADATENATLRLRGALADLEAEALAGKLPRGRTGELEAVRARRRALQPRLDRLPRTAAEVAALAARMQRRVDEVDREVYRLGYQVESIAAAIAASEDWVRRHGAELGGGALAREEFTADLRRQRTIVAMYREQLARLRQDQAVARDAAGGTARAAGDAALRAEYGALLARERELLGGVRSQSQGAEARELERLEEVRERCLRAEAGAERLKARLAAEARRSAAAVAGQLEAEREDLARQQAALAAVDAKSGEVLGQVATRSLGKVRRQFQQLVEKADVGVIDVAWARKRERLERMQQLVQQEEAELEALERSERAVLREVGSP